MRFAIDRCEALPFGAHPKTAKAMRFKSCSCTASRRTSCPETRLYVHLSADEETAVKVGRRHGKPMVYTVDTGAMRRDGYAFYRSVNGVWLTKCVPAQYLRKHSSF